MQGPPRFKTYPPTPAGPWHEPGKKNVSDNPQSCPRVDEGACTPRNSCTRRYRAVHSRAQRCTSLGRLEHGRTKRCMNMHRRALFGTNVPGSTQKCSTAQECTCRPVQTKTRLRKGFHSHGRSILDPKNARAHQIHETQRIHYQHIALGDTKKAKGIRQ